jgi:hypothetical protein
MCALVVGGNEILYCRKLPSVYVAFVFSVTCTYIMYIFVLMQITYDLCYV